MNNNIVNLVRSTVKGTTIVSFDSVTEPKMRKTNNPFFGNVLKASKVNGMMGFDYEKAVNRVAEKEGAEAREAKPRAWGKVTEDKLFVEHKGASYLRVMVRSTGKPVYFFKDSGEEITGSVLEEVKSFMPVSKKSSTQADLEGEVIERTYKIENVKELRFKGMTIG